MSDFLDILDNHRELLQERGYDEIGLGSPDEPGLFMRKLEFLFSECIRKAEYEKEKQDFFIEAFGFFDNENDVIRFNFHYEFDPAKSDINLNSFSATMSGIKRTFLNGPNMYHLIHANRVHKLLCNERQLQESGELTIKPANIDRLVKEQNDLLSQIGYYKTLFPNPPRFIRDELKSTLEQIIGQPSPAVHDIEINRFVHVNKYDFIECSFNYSYDPIKTSLHLVSITAKKDKTEKTFFVGKDKMPLTIQQIYDDVENEQRKQYAKKVAMHAPVKVKSQKL